MFIKKKLNVGQRDSTKIAMTPNEYGFIYLFVCLFKNSTQYSNIKSKIQ